MTDSAEMAGGTAHGLRFMIRGMNASDLEELKDAMLAVGKWVRDASGSFLGHVKMAVDCRTDGAMTLNLTDLDTGTECRGTITFPSDADVRFMAAVLDVGRDGLSNAMENALSERGYAAAGKGIITIM